MDALITINRSIADVFAFVTDQANSKLWKPSVTESRRITAGQIGVGTRFVEGIDVWNRHLTGIVEILEYRPPHWFAYRTLEEPYPFSLSAQMSFETAPAGTSIQGHVDFQGHSPAWNWLIPLVRLYFKSQEKLAFGRLKQVMERASR